MISCIHSASTYLTLLKAIHCGSYFPEMAITIFLFPHAHLTTWPCSSLIKGWIYISPIEPGVLLWLFCQPKVVEVTLCDLRGYIGATAFAWLSQDTSLEPSCHSKKKSRPHRETTYRSSSHQSQLRSQTRARISHQTCEWNSLWDESNPVTIWHQLHTLRDHWVAELSQLPGPWEIITNYFYCFTPPSLRWPVLQQYVSDILM